MLHTISNGLERAVTAVDEWPEFESMLKPVCKSLGDKESKSVILVEMYSDAPTNEQDEVRTWSVDLIDWRWEELEFVLTDLVDLWQHFPARWRPDVFPDEHAKNVTGTSKAVCSSLFRYMMESFLLVVAAVGDEFRWIMGCPCHEIILRETETYHKRRKKMAFTIGSTGICCWKGKRIVYYAMGYAKVQALRVQHATSQRYQLLIVVLQTEDLYWFHRVVAATDQMKSQWAQEHIFKMEYCQHVPVRWCGLFSQYVGYSKADAKRCGEACLSEAMFKHFALMGIILTT
jgi:hypothetical protein